MLKKREKKGVYYVDSKMKKKAAKSVFYSFLLKTGMGQDVHWSSPIDQYMDEAAG